VAATRQLRGKRVRGLQHPAQRDRVAVAPAKRVFGGEAPDERQLSHRMP
jgi:hypothetical protein